MASGLDSQQLSERVEALRDAEPDAYHASAEEVAAFILQVRDLLTEAQAAQETLSGAHLRYLREASHHQVHHAVDRLERARGETLETLHRLYRLGSPPAPNGRYSGEIIAISTGLLSDPFFEWLTRMYTPWQGKTFAASAGMGDNIFTDNAGWKATGKLGWPEYRVADDGHPGTVRVFPFHTDVAPGIDEADLSVLRLRYDQTPNPLPVKRVVDEVVELPGGYLLGKAFMRGLRELRLVAFFGLAKVATE